MRYVFASLMLVVVCQGSFAQQHVVRNSVDPKKRQGAVPPGTFAPITCALVTDVTAQQSGDPCDVVIYNKSETDSLIASAKKEVTDQTALQINQAKIDLSRDINKIPTVALDAFRDQIKTEIKAEVIKELIEEIKAGKLKLGADEPSMKKNQ